MGVSNTTSSIRGYGKETITNFDLVSASKLESENIGVTGAATITSIRGTNASYVNASIQKAKIINASIAQASINNLLVQKLRTINASFTSASIQKAKITNASITNATAGKLTVTQGELNVTQGIARFGVDHDRQGAISLMGHGGGNGGKVILWGGGTADTFIDRYIYAMRANVASPSYSDLTIGPDPDFDSLKHNGLTSRWEFTNPAGFKAITASISDANIVNTLSVGENGNQSGIIVAYGDDSDEGGVIRVHNGGEFNATIPYYQLITYEDDLLIGPQTDEDSLTYTGKDNKWNFTAPGGFTAVAGSIRDIQASSVVASYFNFTATRGADGVGLRVTNDEMQVKRPGDEWRPFGIASEKFWGYSSPLGASGTFYYGGFYAFAGSADDLSATPATAWGTADISYAAHFMVVLGATAVDEITLRIKGTRITDGGARTAGYEANLVIPNAATANNMYETPEKFIGAITAKVISGTAKDVNYGWAKYWDNNNNNFTVKGFETTWLGGANDNTPNISILHHRADGWTYNAGAEPDPPTPIADMNTDHNTEIKVADGEEGAWKRDNLDSDVEGNNQEGTIMAITTSANRTFENGSMILRIENRPNN